MTCPSELLACTESDIGMELAVAAHRCVSWSPEDRGRRTVQDYVEACEAVAQEFAPWATEENVEALRADLECWRAGYAKRLRAYLDASSRCASSAIVGPSNFPVERMRKRQATAEKRLNEWLDWSKAALERLRRQYDPRRLAAAPIGAGDPDALEKLRERLVAAERRQKVMKAANVVVRGGASDEEKARAIMALGVPDTEAWAILKPNCFGDVGYARYEMTNNLSAIKRLRGRIVQIERQRAEDESHGDPRVFEFRWTVGSGETYEGTVCDSQADDRYQIKYSTKPDQGQIMRLKARGFHWSPTLGVWQRQRTANAKYAVQELTGVRL